jgi:hypothetical protein
MADVSATLDILLRTFEDWYGYPPGENSLAVPGDESDRAALATLLDVLGMTPDLLDMYRALDSANLPDVGNGYFVHPPSAGVATLISKRPWTRWVSVLRRTSPQPRQLLDRVQRLHEGAMDTGIQGRRTPTSPDPAGNPHAVRAR